MSCKRRVVFTPQYSLKTFFKRKDRLQFKIQSPDSPGSLEIQTPRALRRSDRVTINTQPNV